MVTGATLGVGWPLLHLLLCRVLATLCCWGLCVCFLCQRGHTTVIETLTWCGDPQQPVAMVGAEQEAFCWRNASCTQAPQPGSCSCSWRAGPPGSGEGGLWEQFLFKGGVGVGEEWDVGRGKGTTFLLLRELPLTEEVYDLFVWYQKLRSNHRGSERTSSVSLVLFLGHHSRQPKPFQYQVQALKPSWKGPRKSISFRETIKEVHSEMELDPQFCLLVSLDWDTQMGWWNHGSRQ